MGQQFFFPRNEEPRATVAKLGQEMRWVAPGYLGGMEFPPADAE